MEGLAGEWQGGILGEVLSWAEDLRRRSKFLEELEFAEEHMMCRDQSFVVKDTNRNRNKI